ncbi:MAG: flagellar protein FlaG [Betaproteobacteria bacterium]|nr:flagellar protein FlaG [Betaproteobacteria bacterium]
MIINQFNATGSLPSSSPALSAREISPSNSNAAVNSSPVSTAEPKSGNDPETREQVKQAVQKIQGTVDNLAHNLRFSIDEDSGKTIIKVTDAHTDEVIRQIPSKESIEIARTLDKVQGLLFNGKA